MWKSNVAAHLLPRSNRFPHRTDSAVISHTLRAMTFRGCETTRSAANASGRRSAAAGRPPISPKRRAPKKAMAQMIAMTGASTHTISDGVAPRPAAQLPLDPMLLFLRALTERFSADCRGLERRGATCSKRRLGCPRLRRTRATGCPSTHTCDNPHEICPPRLARANTTWDEPSTIELDTRTIY